MSVVSPALEGLRDVTDDLECWDDDEDGEKEIQAASAAAMRMLIYVRELEISIVNNAP